MIKLWVIWWYIDYGYATAVARNSTSYPYKINLNASHEKDAFKIWGITEFYKVKVVSSINHQVLSML